MVPVSSRRPRRIGATSHVLVFVLLFASVVTGCASTGYTAPTSTAAACRVQALVGAAGEVDIIPAGQDGVALRITHHSPDVVRQNLQKMWPNGPPAPLQAVQVERSRPKLAIVLDDFGLHDGQLKHVWPIGQPFTYAILPQQRFSGQYSRWLTKRGASILAHIPMEPEAAEHMTLSGFLTRAMTPAQRTELLKAHMASLPGAVGWNNHMGSRLTSDVAAMRSLVGASDPRWLILDSRTSVETTLESAGQHYGRRVARRHVFIDNERTKAAIGRQLLEALALVKSQGSAVAIGHSYPETAAALAAFVRTHGDQVQLVPVERVTAPQASPRWMRTCPRP